jgi:hemoglobin-like flavoprotein
MASELRAIAGTHKAYGVTDEMYDWVGQALLTALTEACGEAWTPAAEESWAEAYRAIVATILAER